jgi:hypothetical protein
MIALALNLIWIGIIVGLMMCSGCANCLRVVETKAGFPAIDEVNCSEVRKDCERLGCEKGYDPHDNVWYYHFDSWK